MDRKGFKNRMKQYKKAREENPGLKYWEWKAIPKYDEGTYGVRNYSTEENPIFYTEESAKDRYIRAIDALKEVGGWSNNLRDEIANEYSIPYIPEKEIRLTTGRYNTGKISTNLLDSIYDSAMRTGVPVDIALGLAGRESTLGIGRGFKKGQSVSGTNLMSNWLQIDPDIPSSKDRDRFNDIRAKILFHDDVSDDEYNFSADYIFDDINSRKRLRKMKENPIDNALKFYQSGKYNPGDKKHSQMVEEDAKILMSDPAIQKWAKEKGIAYAEGGEVGDDPVYTPMKEMYNDKNYFIKNWLSQRKDILAKNASKGRGFIDTFFTSDDEWGDKVLNALLSNLANTKEYSLSGKFLPNVLTDLKLTKALKLSMYNTYSDVRSEFEKADDVPDDYLQYLAGILYGAYYPQFNAILYSYDYERPTVIHERTHALNPTAQKDAIMETRSPRFNILKGFTPGIKWRKEGIDNDDYLDSSSEIYSRLMEFRYLNKMNPKRKYTELDIETMRNDKSTKDFKLLNRYTNEFLLKLFNDVAKVNLEDKRTHKSKQA